MTEKSVRTGKCNQISLDINASKEKRNEKVFMIVILESIISKLYYLLLVYGSRCWFFHVVEVQVLLAKLIKELEERLNC